MSISNSTLPDASPLTWKQMFEVKQWAFKTVNTWTNSEITTSISGILINIVLGRLLALSNSNFLLNQPNKSQHTVLINNDNFQLYAFLVFLKI